MLFRTIGADDVGGVGGVQVEATLALGAARVRAEDALREDFLTWLAHVGGVEHQAA